MILIGITEVPHVELSKHVKQQAALCRGAAEEQAGESVVYVGVDGRGVVGRLGFRDVLRPDSADVVRRLQDMSIRVALLSGDNAAAVGAIAAQAGIQVSILAFVSVSWFVHSCTARVFPSRRRAVQLYINQETAPPVGWMDRCAWSQAPKNASMCTSEPPA